MRRLLAGLLLLVIAVPALAQQNGIVRFDPAPGATSHRLYRDNVLVGPVTNGQTITNLFPANAGTWTFSVEGVNTTGAGPRGNFTATLGPALPGAPVNITITAPCATAQPPTCVITVNP